MKSLVTDQTMFSWNKMDICVCLSHVLKSYKLKMHTGFTLSTLQPYTHLALHDILRTW